MKDIRKFLRIEENRKVSDRTFFLRLREPERESNLVDNLCDTDLPLWENFRAGQFVNIAIPGKYLRRPISVSRYFPKEGEIHLYYNIAGEGTRELSEMKPGDTLDILLDLGNGFSIPEGIKKPLLLGGGIGAAPLFQLAYDLIESGVKPRVVLGYNTSGESWGMEKDLQESGIAAFIATVDGSEGTKGFVTDVIREKALDFDYFYACGPMPMLKALMNLPTEGELSLECRMGCGFGACMCCSMETANGPRRICKEGPVFKKSELKF